MEKYSSFSLYLLPAFKSTPDLDLTRSFTLNKQKSITNTNQVTVTKATCKFKQMKLLKFPNFEASLRIELKILI